MNGISLNDIIPIAGTLLGVVFGFFLNLFSSMGKILIVKTKIIKVKHYDLDGTTDCEFVLELYNSFPKPILMKNIFLTFGDDIIIDSKNRRTNYQIFDEPLIDNESNSNNTKKNIVKLIHIAFVPQSKYNIVLPSRKIVQLKINTGIPTSSIINLNSISIRFKQINRLSINKRIKFDLDYEAIKKKIKERTL